MNYTFLKADITDAIQILSVFQEYQPNGVIHLAAESHVDRLITNPTAFVMTNVIGIVSLLDTSKINKELAYKLPVTFEEGLSIAIGWFLVN